jgi:phage terminase large subunit GpA-like protein
MGIDSGYATAEVYRWCRFRRGKVLAMKGMGTLGQAYGIPNIVEVSGKKKRRGGVRVWPVGPNYIKPILYGALRKERPVGPEARYPKGYVHLADWVSDQEIRQLVSEELVSETSRLGFSKQVWSLIPGRRNEALDCFVYAYAAAAEMGLERMADASWTNYETALNVESAAVDEDRPQSEPVVLQPGPTDRTLPVAAPQPAAAEPVEPPTVIVTPKQPPPRATQTLKLGSPRSGGWFGRR